MADMTAHTRAYNILAKMQQTWGAVRDVYLLEPVIIEAEQAAYARGRKAGRKAGLEEAAKFIEESSDSATSAMRCDSLAALQRAKGGGE